MVEQGYVVARKVLLDAVEALQDHNESLILVGSQAVYLRSPEFYQGVDAYTTDADLAIDPELLGTDPELASRLEAAGFSIEQNSGHWVNAMDIAVDIMVPEGVSSTPTKRSARLDGHSPTAARNARGLEPCMRLNTRMNIVALDPQDTRTVSLKVANNEALLVAKVIKVKERIGHPKRELPKDASDVLRILRQLDIVNAGANLRQEAEHPESSVVIDEALDFLLAQVADDYTPLMQLVVKGTSGVETEQIATVSMKTLVARIHEAYRSA